MARQHHPGIYMKLPPLPHHPDRLAKEMDMPYQSVHPPFHKFTVKK